MRSTLRRTDTTNIDLSTDIRPWMTIRLVDTVAKLLENKAIPTVYK